MSEFLSNEILGIMTVRNLLVIIHLLGLAIGAGAAFFSDFLFTNILKDKTIDKVEYRILRLASQVVWIGLTVLLLSGLAIFAGNSERLLESDKFLAKLTIIAVLVTNGSVFHVMHIPMLKKFLNKDLSKSKEFMEKYAAGFFISGAVSGVSWVAALVLGSLRSLDMSYASIMSLYLFAVGLAAIAALKLKSKLLS